MFCTWRRKSKGASIVMLTHGNKSCDRITNETRVHEISVWNHLVSLWRKWGSISLWLIKLINIFFFHHNPEAGQPKPARKAVGHAAMNVIYFSFRTVTPDWKPTLSHLPYGQAISSEIRYSQFCYNTIVVSLRDFRVIENGVIKTGSDQKKNLAYHVTLYLHTGHRNHIIANMCM